MNIRHCMGLRTLRCRFKTAKGVDMIFPERWKRRKLMHALDIYLDFQESNKIAFDALEAELESLYVRCNIILTSFHIDAIIFPFILADTSL